MGDVYCLGDGMHDALHGFGDGDEQGMDIVESDGAHGGDLEDFVGEWTFSAVDPLPLAIHGEGEVSLFC